MEEMPKIRPTPVMMLYSAASSSTSGSAPSHWGISR